MGVNMGQLFLLCHVQMYCEDGFSPFFGCNVKHLKGRCLRESIVGRRWYLSIYSADSKNMVPSGTLAHGGFHGGTPIAGWFIFMFISWKIPISKWMRTPATPISGNHHMAMEKYRSLIGPWAMFYSVSALSDSRSPSAPFECSPCPFNPQFSSWEEGQHNPVVRCCTFPMIYSYIHQSMVIVMSIAFFSIIMISTFSE